MSERIMKNFPIEYEGNVYWRSRSVAVAGFIFCQDADGEWCVLANRRGPGCPDEVGKWCCVCGYLDFFENGEEAVARETKEETGVIIDPSRVHFDSVMFSTKNDQNVTLRYFVWLEGQCSDYQLSNEYNEKDETTDIKWIGVKDVSLFEWAFGHKNIIIELAGKYL